ncbi:MAG: phosphoribosyltransferase [Candidatus Odinarchaeota archaeon]|nr:phosphoribosyltransferase [Candidatus Odinarchaeota archaeon]
MEKMVFLPISWNKIYDLSIRLAEKIRKSNFVPDLIIGIARGGWIVARLLSDLLDIDDVGSVRIQFYRSVGVTYHEPVVSQPVSISVEKKRVLLCDDVSDTGYSLKTAIEHIKERGAEIVKTATLHQKSKTVLIPDYWVEKTDAWIIYPWERRETVIKLIQSFITETPNISTQDLIKKLKVTGLDETLLRLFVKWAKEDSLV